MIRTGQEKHSTAVFTVELWYTRRIRLAYNFVFTCTVFQGADAVQNPGKMVLLDGDGLTGTNVPAEDELMSSPDTLKAFINYCAAHFPAKKYDLILWDHGDGPFRYAFAKDEHDSSMLKMMSFSGFAKALRECDVTQGGKKFGMIRCSMRISLSAARHSPSARTMRAVSP